MAAASPKAVASRASAIPGATTARLVVCDFEMPMKLFMMPHTVPNRPTNGEVAPIVANKPVPRIVRDALQNVAGITFRAGEGGNQGDTPYIRGFQSNNDIFRDGVRDPGWYTRDTFGIDAVEVYKGPSSILFGRGSTGGVVNLVTRTPVDRTYNEATITANTGPGVRGQVDSNYTFGDGAAARLLTMGQLYDIAGRDHVEQNRWGVAPSLKFKATEQTKVTLSYIHQHDDSIPDYGIPFLTPAWGVPRYPAPFSAGPFPTPRKSMP